MIPPAREMAVDIVMTSHAERARTGPGLVLIAMLAFLFSAEPALANLPVTSSPRLHLRRLIRTTPFVGSSVTMKDAEGSAYVPRDRSLWLADDNGRAIYEVGLKGRLKRVIGRSSFSSARRFGGGPQAGTYRTRDFENMAYDRAHDSLYVFSGPCCASAILPTVFRLKRDARGIFRVESYQPLPKTSNFTAAAWNGANGKLYVGGGRTLRTYDYATNRSGPVFTVPNLVGITGMGFSSNGDDLFVTTDTERLRRVRWKTRRLVAGWTFGLKRFGVRDGRAVELISGRFFVLDGWDGRRRGSRFKYAVFVFDVLP